MPTAIALPDPAKLDPATRARIEDVVIATFSAREFHRVGLIEIARGAHVSLQTIYKYYGSKEALLFSGLDSALGVLAARLMAHLRSGEDYKQRLRGVVRSTLEFFEQNPRLIQLILTSIYLSTWRQTETFHSPELFSALMKLLAEARERGILRREVDEKILFDYLFGAVFRLVQGYVRRGMAEPLSPRADLLFEMLWRAIAAPAEASPD